MNKNKLDLGLQPERTSMSWSRTLLLILGNSLLLFMIGMHQNYLILEVMGGLMVLFAIVGTAYNKQRFNLLFFNAAIIGTREILIKKSLSIIILLSAITYIFFIFSKFFYA